MEKKQRIVIIGAGPTGLGEAYRLYELGVLRSKTQVVILEQTSKPGGLADSYRDKLGFVWDNGGNIIHSHYPYFDNVLNKVVPEWKGHILGESNYTNASSFDEWLVKSNGDTLCEVFRRKYNSSLWAVDPSDIKFFWMPHECFAVPNVKVNISGAEMGLRNETKSTKWSPNPSFQHSHYCGTGVAWQWSAYLSIHLRLSL